MVKNLFSDNNDFAAKYISRPGLGGYGGILTFSPVKGGGTPGAPLSAVDKALLCNNVMIQFGRTVARQYFLNVSGTSYTIGRGSGVLTIDGMLGKASDFATMFGTDYTDPCKNLFTVKLDAFGMMPCSTEGETSNVEPGIIVMSGVIATQIQIGTQTTSGDGTLYYTASANFEIAGLGVDDQQSNTGRNTEEYNALLALRRGPITSNSTNTSNGA